MTAPPIAATSTTESPGLVSGTIASLGLRVLAVSLGFTFNVLLARELGAGEAGLYLLAFNIVTILALASRLGLDNVVVRTLAFFRADGDWGGVRGVIVQSTRLTLAAGAVLTLVSWSSAGWVSDRVLGVPALAAPIAVLALATVPMALGTLWGEVLRGLARIRAAQTVKFVSTRLAILVGFLIVGGAWGATGVSWVTGGACLLTVALAAWLLSRRAPWRRARTRVVPVPELLSSGSTLFATNVIVMIAERIPLFILAAATGSADAGIFASAFRTAALLSLLLQAVDAAAAPQFAALHRAGETRTLARLGRTATRGLIVATVPALVLFVVFRDPIMSVFGPEFLRGGLALAILAGGQAVGAVVGPTSTLLVMCGHERLRLRIVLLSAPLGTTLSVVLVPALGLAGAALATAFTWSLQNVLEYIGVRRVLGIRLLPRTLRDR